MSPAVECTAITIEWVRSVMNSKITPLGPVPSAYIQVSNITRKFKVFSVQQCLIIKVRSHIVRDGYHEASDLRKVTLITCIGFEECKLDHMAIIAAGAISSDGDTRKYKCLAGDLKYHLLVDTRNRHDADAIEPNIVVPVKEIVIDNISIGCSPVICPPIITAVCLIILVLIIIPIRAIVVIHVLSVFVIVSIRTERS
jgi:hypothetical protein